MRKVKIFLLIALTLAMIVPAGCSEITGIVDYLPFDEIPADYSLDEAKSDRCVVLENSDITSGQDIWDDFLAAVSADEKSMVRLAFYYEIDDPSRYDPTLYEEIKNDYPVLYVNDLNFDGKKYEILSTDNGKKVRKTYSYMKKYEGSPSSENATFSKYLRYVLVNDGNVKWEDIEHGMFSSMSGDWIDHFTVYIDLEPLPTPEISPSESPSPSPEPELTPDQKFRKRIKALSTHDGQNVIKALADLDSTCAGLSDDDKDLYMAHFLAWFADATFWPNSMERFGDLSFDGYEDFDEIEELLKDCAVFVKENIYDDYVYVLPRISQIPDLAPNAVTPDSLKFFRKFALLEEPTHLLWGRDGPGPEWDLILNALAEWDDYCMSIKTEEGIWSFPEVEGFPGPWTPEGMLKMLRMKFICDEQFSLPGTYMFRKYDNRLSGGHRDLYANYINYHPDTDTSVLLAEYLEAMEAGDWFINDAAREVLKKYGLAFSSECNIRENPINMQNTT